MLRSLMDYEYVFSIHFTLCAQGNLSVSYAIYVIDTRQTNKTLQGVVHDAFSHWHQFMCCTLTLSHHSFILQGINQPLEGSLTNIILFYINFAMESKYLRSFYAPTIYFLIMHLRMQMNSDLAPYLLRNIHICNHN